MINLNDDIIINHSTTVYIPHVFKIPRNDPSKLSEIYVSSHTITIPEGYITEVKKRLEQQVFYQSARRKRQIEDRIIRHAVAIAQSLLSSVTQCSDDSGCSYRQIDDWETFYRFDKWHGFRTISKEFWDGICGKTKSETQLKNLLTSNFTILVSSEERANTTTIETSYNVEQDTTIGGTVRVYPPMIEMKRENESSRASNIFRLNPYFMRQKRMTTNVLSPTDLQHITSQQEYMIKTYGVGHQINMIEARNMQDLKLCSTEEASAILEALKGQVYKDGELLDDSKIQELTDDYYRAKRDIENGKFSFLKKAENRHYTPLQRVPRPIREHIAKLNSMREPDYKSLHPNLIYSILMQTLDTEWFKLNGIDIDWLYDRGFVPELSEESLCWIRKNAGNVKTNLSVYFTGDVEKSKKENLSYYNDKIRQMKYYHLHKVYEEHCPELVQFLQNVKRGNHKKMSTLLLKMESVLMGYIVVECDKRNIPVNGIHDSVMVPTESFDEVKALMNDLAQSVGLSSYVG